LSIVIGQIGVGRWGKNILRNLANLKNCTFTHVCDSSLDQIEKYKKDYPQVSFLSNPENILSDKNIQALVIATPVASHFSLAKQALLSGKHVFVEKPIVLEPKQLEELTEISQERSLVLMEGHLLLYHGAIQKMKKAIAAGLIGNIHHLYLRRTNLGAIRTEANVLWDVGPHDISILNFLLNGEPPEQISALGKGVFLPDNQETIFTTVKFKNGIIANIHESWLDPFKERKAIAVGDKGMLILDEHDPQAKLRWIKKQIVDTENALEHLRFKYIDEGQEKINYQELEPLNAELQHFVNCIAEGKEPISNSKNSLQVLRILCACQKSLESNGNPVRL